MGIANEMPAKAPVREKICELMPTTSPRMLSSGPPELPGFTATSVWMNGTASMLGSCERLSRLVALTMPAVTVLAKPYGEPMATTHSPGRSRRESPIFTTGRLLASTLITATSLRRSTPITLALQLALVGEADLDVVGVLDHVGVGHDVAVGGDDEAGAEAEGAQRPLGRLGRGAPPRGARGCCCCSGGMKRLKNS